MADDATIVAAVGACKVAQGLERDLPGANWVVMSAHAPDIEGPTILVGVLSE